MASVKTAISIQESLLKEADNWSRQLKIPRSHFFALAVTEFIQQHRNQKLLDEINQAYSDGLESTEKKLLASAKRRHSKLAQEKW